MYIMPKIERESTQMIQMLFSVKFQSQLRRTRPEVFDALEKTVAQSIEDAGGIIKRSFHSIVAEFDEASIGFWVDVLSMLEGVSASLEQYKKELFGWTCVLSENIDDDIIPLLMRQLPSKITACGIWCTPLVREALTGFAAFKDDCLTVSYDGYSNSFTEIETLKNESDKSDDSLIYNKIYNAVKDTIVQNIVLHGKSFTGKRAALQKLCKELYGDIKPLVFRFGKYGSPLNAFTDALSPDITFFLDENKIEKRGELETLHEQLFRGRLRFEPSKHILQRGRRYLSLLLEDYSKAVIFNKKIPVIVLENIENASIEVQEIFTGALSNLPEENQPVIYAACSAEIIPENFIKLFNRVIDCPQENIPVFRADDAAPGLWEIAYACELFEKYFPVYSFLNLFGEEGKNINTIKKTFLLLYAKKIIKSVDVPLPELVAFNEGVEKLLGERTFFIQAIVKKRLLDWVHNGKISPCYNLLEALRGLGAEISDSLTLEAIKSDLNNGTIKAIEDAIERGTFSKVIGEERAPALRYCFTSMRALLFGNENTIEASFQNVKQEDSAIPIYKSQILAIEADFKMAQRDINGALDSVKESMVIIQGIRANKEVAQVYRLFSIVHLAKRELTDAMEYLSFATDDAEKHKNFDELSVSAYYSATAHFIYGNLSKAERLIKQAENSARIAGRTDWALRSQFFLARFYFEIGKYKNALAIFKTLLDLSDERKSLFAKTLAAWVFRTELYLYERMPVLPPDRNSDAMLFELEGLYLTGEYDKTAALADKLLDKFSVDDFLFIEQPDWRSGFAQCELIEFTPHEFWSRMVTVWKSLALCRTKTTAVDEAVRSMQKIMRDERFSDYDPNAPFYFFAHYRVLNETQSSEVDRNTAISMVFKRLQRRASRIDDNETRRTFLSNQYWNKIIFNTAKEYKLI
jgi:tetratricopeptide (TPR) repeat protein